MHWEALLYTGTRKCAVKQAGTTLYCLPAARKANETYASFCLQFSPYGERQSLLQYQANVRSKGRGACWGHYSELSSSRPLLRPLMLKAMVCPEAFPFSFHTQCHQSHSCKLLLYASDPQIAQPDQTILSHPEPLCPTAHPAGPPAI